MADEFIGYGVDGKGYGQVMRAQVPAGAWYWRLDNEASHFEDPFQGGSENHNIYVSVADEQWVPGIVCHISNAATWIQPYQWDVTLDYPPNTNHTGQLEFTMWGMGNEYTAYMVGDPGRMGLSDTVRGMIMPGNVHVSYHLEYVWTRSDAPPAYANLEAMLLGTGEIKQVIQFNPTAALQKAIFQAQMVPNSPEFAVSWQGIPYVGQRAESLTTGKVRVYYAQVGAFDRVLYVERP